MPTQDLEQPIPPPEDSPPSPAEERTTWLARQARQGDQPSFGSLFERVAPAIYAFAAARLDGRWHDAEDAVAETWVRAWAKFEAYDPERPFRAWIFGFASRVVLEMQRRLSRAGTVVQGLESSRIPADATSVSRLVARDESAREFICWARTLSEYEREVLILRGLQGWPHEGVAEALGRTVFGVKACWQRLLEKIAERGLRPSALAEAGEEPRASSEPE